MNQQAVAAQIKRPLAYRTNCLRTCSLLACSESPLLPDYPQIVFQEQRDIMVDNRRRYVLENKVLVFRLWDMVHVVSD